MLDRYAGLKIDHYDQILLTRKKDSLLWTLPYSKVDVYEDPLIHVLNKMIPELPNIFTIKRIHDIYRSVIPIRNTKGERTDIIVYIYDAALNDITTFYMESYMACMDEKYRLATVDDLLEWSSFPVNNAFIQHLEKKRYGEKKHGKKEKVYNTFDTSKRYNNTLFGKVPRDGEH